MPWAPKVPCAVPGCVALVESGRCVAHRIVQEHGRANYDDRRRYRTARWASLRRTVLEEQPICGRCADAGRIVAATDVDHVRRPGADPGLFWDRGNLQGLCRSCHAAKTARGE